MGLMSQVYSRAEQVLIWLGPEADGLDVVMDALAELGREFESSGVDFGNAEMIDEMIEGLRAGVELGASLGEGIDPACGGDKVVDTTGHDGAVAGDGGGLGIGVDLGADVGGGVADAKVLGGATTTCNTNKANARTGKTIMKVVEEGAARLVRLWASGELQSLFRRPWFTRVWVVQKACLCDDIVFVCGTKPPVDHDIFGAICMYMIYAIREFDRKGGYAPEWDGASPIQTDAELAGVRMPKDVARASVADSSRPWKKRKVTIYLRFSSTCTQTSIHAERRSCTGIGFMLCWVWQRMLTSWESNPTNPAKRQLRRS